MGALLASVTLVSAGFAQAEDSGYLGDYAALSEVKDSAGDTVMRYVNPKLKPGAYQAVMLDPTQYYPAPKPTGQVTSSTLTDISRYLDKGLRDKLGAKVKVVSEAGPGVLRIRPAITAVAADRRAEALPGHSCRLHHQFGEGPRKEAAIHIEVDVVDSVTGDAWRFCAQGNRREAGKRQCSTDAGDVRPLLDKWIDTGSSFVAEHVK